MDAYDIAPLLRQPTDRNRIVWIEHSTSSQGEFVHVKAVSDNRDPAGRIVAGRGSGDIVRARTDLFLREVGQRLKVELKQVSEAVDRPTFLEQAERWVAGVPQARLLVAVGTTCLNTVRNYGARTDDVRPILEHARSVSAQEEDAFALSQ